MHYLLLASLASAHLDRVLFFQQTSSWLFKGTEFVFQADKGKPAFCSAYRRANACKSTNHTYLAAHGKIFVTTPTELCVFANANQTHGTSYTAKYTCAVPTVEWCVNIETGQRRDAAPDQLAPRPRDCPYSEQTKFGFMTKINWIEYDN